MTLSVQDPEGFPDKHPVLDPIKQFNELVERVYDLRVQAAAAYENRDCDECAQVAVDMMREAQRLEDLMKEFV